MFKFVAVIRSIVWFLFLPYFFALPAGEGAPVDLSDSEKAEVQHLLDRLPLQHRFHGGYSIFDKGSDGALLRYMQMGCPDWAALQDFMKTYIEPIPAVLDCGQLGEWVRFNLPESIVYERLQQDFSASRQATQAAITVLDDFFTSLNLGAEWLVFCAGQIRALRESPFDMRPLEGFSPLLTTQAEQDFFARWKTGMSEVLAREASIAVALHRQGEKLREECADYARRSSEYWNTCRKQFFLGEVGKADDFVVDNIDDKSWDTILRAIHPRLLADPSLRREHYLRFICKNLLIAAILHKQLTVGRFVEDPGYLDIFVNVPLDLFKPRETYNLRKNRWEIDDWFDSVDTMCLRVRLEVYNGKLKFNIMSSRRGDAEPGLCLRREGQWYNMAKELAYGPLHVPGCGVAPFPVDVDLPKDFVVEPSPEHTVDQLYRTHTVAIPIEKDLRTGKTKTAYWGLDPEGRRFWTAALMRDLSQASTGRVLKLWGLAERWRPQASLIVRGNHIFDLFFPIARQGLQYDGHDAVFVAKTSLADYMMLNMLIMSDSANRRRALEALRDIDAKQAVLDELHGAAAYRAQPRGATLLDKKIEIRHALIKLRALSEEGLREVGASLVPLVEAQRLEDEQRERERQARRQQRLQEEQREHERNRVHDIMRQVRAANTPRSLTTGAGGGLLARASQDSPDVYRNAGPRLSRSRDRSRDRARRRSRGRSPTARSSSRHHRTGRSSSSDRSMQKRRRSRSRSPRRSPHQKKT